MLPFLQPRPTLTEQETRASLRLFVWEGVTTGAMFALGSGGLMAAFALALGANNLQVGLLAALPFLAEIGRLPAILALERLRARKALGLPALVAMNLWWVPIALVPVFLATPGQPAVFLIILFLGLRGLFAPFWSTTATSWLRDLVPPGSMASYFGRRLALMTIATAAVGLAGSFFVQWWQGRASPGDEALAFSFLLVGGVLTLGVAGPIAVSRAVEPSMPLAASPGRPPLAILLEPVRDRNYSHLVRFLFVWSLTSSLAIPFFAVYMLKEIGLPLPLVIGLTALGLVSNVVFVRVWGPLADRVGSKSVLSLSASLYLLVIVGWVFTMNPDRHFLTLPLLIVLHGLGGVAAAGVMLTANTLALKISPDDRAVAYANVAGMVTNVGAGIGPILGGLLADFFSVRTLGFVFTWETPQGLTLLTAVSLTGFDFLFIMAFLFGLMSLNLLVALREEGEVPRDAVLAELMARVEPLSRVVSSVPGLNFVTALSYGYLRRVPGADVALGVTAYQLADSIRVAVASAGRGRAAVSEIASQVGVVLDDAAEGMEDVAGHGLELALHATRGAVLATDDIAGQVRRVTRGAVLGTLRKLDDLQVDPVQSVHGAAYGAVQGALEAHRDLAETTEAAAAAVREAVRELGISEEEAATAAATGMRDAAIAAGGDALEQVMEALPPDFVPEAAPSPSTSPAREPLP